MIDQRYTEISPSSYMTDQPISSQAKNAVSIEHDSFCGNGMQFDGKCLLPGETPLKDSNKKRFIVTDALDEPELLPRSSPPANLLNIPSVLNKSGLHRAGKTERKGRFTIIDLEPDSSDATHPITINYNTENSSMNDEDENLLGSSIAGSLQGNDTTISAPNIVAQRAQQKRKTSPLSNTKPIEDESLLNLEVGSAHINMSDVDNTQIKGSKKVDISSFEKKMRSLLEEQDELQCIMTEMIESNASFLLNPVHNLNYETSSNSDSFLPPYQMKSKLGGDTVGSFKGKYEVIHTYLMQLESKVQKLACRNSFLEDKSVRLEAQLNHEKETSNVLRSQLETMTQYTESLLQDESDLVFNMRPDAEKDKQVDLQALDISKNSGLVTKPSPTNSILLEVDSFNVQSTASSDIKQDDKIATKEQQMESSVKATDGGNISYEDKKINQMIVEDTKKKETIPEDASVEQEKPKDEIMKLDPEKLRSERRNYKQRSETDLQQTPKNDRQLPRKFSNSSIQKLEGKSLTAGVNLSSSSPNDTLDMMLKSQTLDLAQNLQQRDGLPPLPRTAAATAEKSISGNYPLTGEPGLQNPMSPYPQTPTNIQRHQGFNVTPKSMNTQSITSFASMQMLSNAMHVRPLLPTHMAAATTPLASAYMQPQTQIGSGLPPQSPYYGNIAMNTSQQYQGQKPINNNQNKQGWAKNQGVDPDGFLF